MHLSLQIALYLHLHLHKTFCNSLFGCIFIFRSPRTGQAVKTTRSCPKQAGTVRSTGTCPALYWCRWPLTDRADGADRVHQKNYRASQFSFFNVNKAFKYVVEVGNCALLTHGSVCIVAIINCCYRARRMRKTNIEKSDQKKISGTCTQVRLTDSYSSPGFPKQPIRNPATDFGHFLHIPFDEVSSFENDSDNLDSRRKIRFLLVVPLSSQAQ